MLSTELALHDAKGVEGITSLGESLNLGCHFLLSATASPSILLTKFKLWGA